MIVNGVEKPLPRPMTAQEYLEKTDIRSHASPWSETAAYCRKHPLQKRCWKMEIHWK